MNKKKTKPGASSRFKGVHWHSTKRVWFASLMLRGKTVFKKRFHHEVDAAMAYDRAAIKHHGPFAATNDSLGLLPKASMG